MLNDVFAQDGFSANRGHADRLDAVAKHLRHANQDSDSDTLNISAIKRFASTTRTGATNQPQQINRKRLDNIEISQGERAFKPHQCGDFDTIVRNGGIAA